MDTVAAYTATTTKSVFSSDATVCLSSIVFCLCDCFFSKSKLLHFPLLLLLLFDGSDVFLRCGREIRHHCYCMCVCVCVCVFVCCNKQKDALRNSWRMKRRTSLSPHMPDWQWIGAVFFFFFFWRNSATWRLLQRTFWEKNPPNSPHF